jgi:hypothetical protein
MCFLDNNQVFVCLWGYFMVKILVKNKKVGKYPSKMSFFDDVLCYLFGCFLTFLYFCRNKTLDMKDKLIRAGNEAEWMAKFQQQPYVREGLLFGLDELGYFNGVLPVGHKFRFVVNCDVAFGGGDSVSMPIGLQDLTDEIVYIVDWYFNSSGVSITVPGVVDMIIKHGIKNITFEANAGGQLYASKVQEELRKRNYLCSCDSVRAPNNLSKEDKIKACEGIIRQKFRFLDGTKHDPEEYDDETTIYERSASYERALEEMGTYVTIGKNLHDDACDSIAQIAERIFDTLQRRTVIMDCPF